MKKGVLKLGLSGLLAANLLLVGNILPPVEGVFLSVGEVRAEASKEMKKVKGKITNISQKAKTIALAKKDKSFFLLKFTDETELKGIKSSKELKVGEAIIVKFKNVNGENLATSLEKALVKLPKGTKEIKTDALSELLNKDKNIVVVDARPLIKFGESHIADAVSVPFSKLTKMGDDGAKLLEKYKDRQLVFYCGGPT
ncbi:MAG: rhodanese-like domain-containing protein [Desulfobulbaceae bacterium]|nr:rhodanese-like domain-containing protein [Desulfobulbaceae bacterium]